MRRIVLASTSPRRKKIMEMTGLDFEICASDYQEDLTLSLRPRELARFLSRKKAEAVAGKFSNTIIIAADTFIVCNGRRLGKPHTAQEAGKMLRALNGKVHSVITGFTLVDTGSERSLSRSIETSVHFRRLSGDEITAYAGSGEPLDKAGAYAIQGAGAIFIKKIDGDFFNVMGLPLCALTESLKKFGVEVLKEGFSVRVDSDKGFPDESGFAKAKRI